MIKDSFPLVSIVIITYNDENNILESIQSALNQTYRNIEVIVVDDGSTDNTSSLIKKYNSNVKYIYQNNSGIGSARSLGLDSSVGKYVQFLDSDDILPNDKIEWQSSFLDSNSDYAFVYGNTKCFYVSDNLEESWDHPSNKLARSGNLLMDIINNGNFINIGQPLFNRSDLIQIGGWDSCLKGSDDQDVMIRLALNGSLGAYVDKTAYFYRHIIEEGTNNSIARHKLIDRYEGELRAWLKLEKNSLNHFQIKKVKRKISFIYFQLSKAYYKTDSKKVSLKMLLKAFSYNKRIKYLFFFCVVILVDFGRLKMILNK